MNVMGLCIRTDKDKDLVLTEFREYLKAKSSDEIAALLPSSYAELKKGIVKKSCLIQMIRRIPYCQRCDKLLKINSFFCPECLQHNALSPIWRGCKTKNCYQEEDVKVLMREYYEGMDTQRTIEKAKEMCCSHSAKMPFSLAVSYIPAVAYIAELLRSRVWSSLPFSSPCGIVEAIRQGEAGQTHPVVSLNALSVFERMGCSAFASSLHCISLEWDDYLGTDFLPEYCKAIQERQTAINCILMRNDISATTNMERHSTTYCPLSKESYLVIS